MKIRELMTREVVTIDSEATVEELEKLLTATSVSGVPVLAEYQELVGIVTKTDVTRHLATAAVIEADRESTQVWQIMTPSVIAGNAESPVEEVAKMMVDAGVHRVLLYENRKVVGIVTSFDFVRLTSLGPKPQQ
jgi:CBS domain-containing protein